MCAKVRKISTATRHSGKNSLPPISPGTFGSASENTRKSSHDKMVGNWILAQIQLATVKSVQWKINTQLSPIKISKCILHKSVHFSLQHHYYLWISLKYLCHLHCEFNPSVAASEWGQCHSMAKANEIFTKWMI